jgi:PPP family 3-phenylpropionic acid transporter
MLLNLLTAQGLRFGREEIQQRFWSGMGVLLSNRRWVFFLLMAFVCGVGMASTNIYQFVYMAEIGANKSLMGLSLTISTLSELPVMIFGGWLLKRLKPLGLMTLGMVVIGLRVLLYSAFNFPDAILLFQLLHGLTYPAIWMPGLRMPMKMLRVDCALPGRVYLVPAWLAWALRLEVSWGAY